MQVKLRSRLPFLCEILQAKSVNFNMNLRNQEFHMRAKKFTMQNLLVLELVTQIHDPNRKLFDFKMTSVWALDKCPAQLQYK